jgi:hypothetical protein
MSCIFILLGYPKTIGLEILDRRHEVAPLGHSPGSYRCSSIFAKNSN